MRKLLAAALLFAVFAGPAFAAKKPHHKKVDYSYHTPKYKASKYKVHHVHTQKLRQHKAK